MTLNKTFLIIFIVLAIGAGGYFLLKGGSQGPTQKSSPQETPQGQSSTATGVEAAKIIAKNFAFNPSVTDIEVGKTVTWLNEDSAPHQIADKPNGDIFKSAILPQGQSFSFTFDKAGQYEYFCTLHPSMIGKIIVKE